MRSSAPPALAACLKPRAWRLCALLGASAGRRMKALRLALRGVPVAGGFGLLACAPLTLTRGVALRRRRRTSPLSSRRLARPAPLPLLVLRSAGRRLVPLLSVLPARRARPHTLTRGGRTAPLRSSAPCCCSVRLQPGYDVGPGSIPRTGLQLGNSADSRMPPMLFKVSLVSAVAARPAYPP